LKQKHKFGSFHLEREEEPELEFLLWDVPFPELPLPVGVEGPDIPGMVDRSKALLLR